MFILYIDLSQVSSVIGNGSTMSYQSVFTADFLCLGFGKNLHPKRIGFFRTSFLLIPPCCYTCTHTLYTALTYIHSDNPFYILAKIHLAKLVLFLWVYYHLFDLSTTSITVPSFLTNKLFPPTSKLS